jgi:hypothetical protein
MIPSSIFSPNIVKGGQFIKAITTKDMMKNKSAMQHQAAKGLLSISSTF